MPLSFRRRYTVPTCHVMRKKKQYLRYNAKTVLGTVVSTVLRHYLLFMAVDRDRIFIAGSVLPLQSLAATVVNFTSSKFLTSKCKFLIYTAPKNWGLFRDGWTDRPIGIQLQGTPLEGSEWQNIGGVSSSRQLLHIFSVLMISARVLLCIFLLLL